MKVVTSRRFYAFNTMEDFQNEPDNRLLVWLDAYFDAAEIVYIEVSDVPQKAIDYFHEEYNNRIDNPNAKICKISGTEIYFMQELDYFYMVEFDNWVLIWSWSFDKLSDWNVYVSDTRTLDNKGQRGYFGKRRLEIMNSFSKSVLNVFLSSDAIFHHPSAIKRRLELVNEWRAESYIDDFWKTRYKFV